MKPRNFPCPLVKKGHRVVLLLTLPKFSLGITSVKSTKACLTDNTSRKICKSAFLFKFTLQFKFAGCAAWNPLSPVNLGDSALVSKNIYFSFLSGSPAAKATSKNNQILKCVLRNKKRRPSHISLSRHKFYDNICQKCV